MTNEDDIGVLLGEEADAEILLGIPLLRSQFLDVNLRIICPGNDSLLLLSRLFLSLFLLDLWSVGIFVLLFVQLEIVTLAFLLDVVQLLFVELETNRIIRFYCFQPDEKILEGWHLEAKDVIGDVGLKIIKEAEVFFDLLLRPLLIDSFLELLYDL
jgi:hypothetical protein